MRRGERSGRGRGGPHCIRHGQDAGRVFKAVDEGTAVYREIYGACSETTAGLQERRREQC